MLQGQANCQAFAFRINTFSLIYVKQPEVLEERSSLFTDIRKQIAGHYRLAHQHCDIPSDFREASELRELRQTPFDNAIQTQLEDEYRAMQVQLVEQLRMQCAEPTYLLAITDNARSLPRVQCRMLG